MVDSFEAMTSDRPYRKALAIDEAIQILLEGRGKQWDPTIVNAFVDMIISEVDEKNLEDRSIQQKEPAESQTALTSPQQSLSI